MSEKLFGGRRRHSDATIALLKRRAQERGEKRSDAFEQRIREVMKEIDEEIAKNGGVYPHNKGEVSGAELARRAGVHETTIYSPSQKKRRFNVEVKNWVDSFKTKGTASGTRVRRGIAERLEDWRSQFEGLAQSHRDTELDLQNVQGQLEVALKRILVLEEENRRNVLLLSTNGTANIIPFQAKES